MELVCEWKFILTIKYSMFDIFLEANFYNKFFFYQVTTYVCMHRIIYTILIILL